MSTIVEISSYSESYVGILITFGSTTTKLSQSFTPSVYTKAKYCTLYMSKNVAASGTFVVRLYKSSGVYGYSSIPTGNYLATTDNINVSTLSTGGGLVTCNFTNEVYLFPDQYYCLVVETAGLGGQYGRWGIGGGGIEHGNRASYTTSWSPLSSGTSLDPFSFCYHLYGEQITWPNKSKNASIFDNQDKSLTPWKDNDII